MGPYRDNKTRPILVKLDTAWNRRLILAGSKKLKDYASRIFIRPDEPLEVRRKNTLERLKQRAEREGKNVVIDDQGVLCVDGIVTYTVKEGFITDTGSDSIPHGRHREN